MPSATKQDKKLVQRTFYIRANEYKPVEDLISLLLRRAKTYKRRFYSCYKGVTIVAKPDSTFRELSKAYWTGLQETMGY